MRVEQQTSEVALTQGVLDRVKFRSDRAISAEALKSSEISRHMDYLADQLIIGLKTEVLAKPLGRITISFPATVWDTFKKSYAPAWYLRRHPIRYSYKVVSCQALFPEAQIPIPALGRPTYYIRRTT